MTRYEKEKFILAIFLFDEQNLNIEGLDPSLFQNDKFRTIFKALQTIYKENPQNCNNITLINYLKMIDKLDYVGGEPEIVGLQDEIPDIGTRKKVVTITKQLRNLNAK